MGFKYATGLVQISEAEAGQVIGPDKFQLGFCVFSIAHVSMRAAHMNKN